MAITSLVSVFQYSEVTKQTLTTEQKTTIEGYLGFATDIVNSYCNRILTVNNYNEWIENKDGISLWTSQYPINRVYFVGIPQIAGNIKNTNVSAVTSSMSYDSNVFSLSHYDTNGDLNDSEILQSNVKTLSTLETLLEVDNAWSVNINSDYINYSTKFVKPFDCNDAQEQFDIEIADSKSIKSKIVDKQGLELNCATTDVYVEYNAGYTPATDNLDHTALATQGNVPSDLVWVICNIISDLYVNDMNMVREESINDVDQSKFDTQYNDNIVEKYKVILDKYRKLEF
jgi:hypothetical protein